MLDALTLDQLRTFVAVVEAGGFRAGAARIARVQSAVSHAIANLEAQLGVALFDRTGHRPVLTPAGKSLLADARAILLKVDAMRARARGLGEGVELGLSIAVDSLFPPADLAAALRELQDAYPAVAVQVQVGTLGGPLAALAARRCAFGITCGDSIRHQGIELEVLGSVTMVAVVAAGHPMTEHATRAPLSATDLADYVQIVVEDPSPLTEGRDFGVLSTATWRVGDMATKRALILAGVGWGAMPTWAVEHDLADGRLVRVSAAARGARGETVSRSYLARRTDEALGPAARRFRQALRQLAGLPREG